MRWYLGAQRDRRSSTDANGTVSIGLTAISTPAHLAFSFPKTRAAETAGLHGRSRRLSYAVTASDRSLCKLTPKWLAMMGSPDLIKVTEIFLVPSSFLVAALGTADTNPHRALISVLGLVISLLWYVCSKEALAEQAAVGANRTHRLNILSWLAVVFIVGWMISTIGHAVLWSRPLGT